MAVLVPSLARESTRSFPSIPVCGGDPHETDRVLNKSEGIESGSSVPESFRG